MRRRSNFGQYGGHIEVLDMYEDWRDERLLEEADGRADFATFLFGPVSQSVYKGYQRVQPQYRRYASIEGPRDFRAHRIRGLNDLVGFGYVGEFGEFPEMKRTERPSAAIAVDTYGAQYRVTRHLIRSDDTGEIVNGIPENMGRQAGLFVSRLLISLIESNPVGPDGVQMFHATHNNTHVLPASEDALATVVGAMEDQVDDSGNPIVIRPATVAVKSLRMQMIFRRILQSQFTGTSIEYTPGAAGLGSAIFDKGNLNPLSQDVLPLDGVVRDPFWTDANDWYVFADPNDVPGFALAFLDGNETPFVGIKNPEVRNALGPGEDPYLFEPENLAYKVRLDTGAAPVDYRGVARSIVP